MDTQDDMIMGATYPSSYDSQKERFYKRVRSEIIAKSIDGIISEESKMKLELGKYDYS